MALSGIDIWILCAIITISIDQHFAIVALVLTSGQGGGEIMRS